MTTPPSSALSLRAVIRESYATFFANLTPHVVLSYLYSLPLGLFVLTGGLDLSALSPGDGLAEVRLPTGFWIFFLISFAAAAILHLIYFRLYLLGRDRYLKFSLPALARMVGKMLLYSLLFVLLLFIFMLAANMVIGLVTLIVSAVTGHKAVAGIAMGLAGLTLSVMLFSIALRLLQTFVSIAGNERFLPFREAWYYTRGQGLRLVLIYLAVLAPAWSLVFAASALIAALLPGSPGPELMGGGPVGQEPASPVALLIQLLISPLGVAPGALMAAASSRIYHRLIPHPAPDGHKSDAMF